MLVFIDESGDAGFKLNKGSSRFFVIVLVVFDDDLDAEETALLIKKYRRKLGKGQKFEFKFNQCSKKYREEFLSVIVKGKFRVRAIVFDKKIVYSSFLRSTTDSFYRFALKTILDHNNDTIREAKLRLDALGERKFRKELSTYLRQYLNTDTKKVMQNLRFRESNDDVLIQLADMIAGSIRRFYEHRTLDYKIYKEIIEPRIEDCWEFK